MPADAKHPSYDTARSQWDTIRDMIQGASALRKNAEKYVPRLKEQSAADYATFVKRAVFFAATGRTQEALSGMLLRRKPKVEAPKEVEAVLTMDVDGKAHPFETYAGCVVRELVTVGRCGTLVDWNQVDRRAFFTFYTAEEIINWRVAIMGGRVVLTLLVLREEVAEPEADGFGTKCVVQWRSYRLLQEEGRSPAVVVEVWRKNDTTTELYVHSTARPERHGVPLEAIPFTIHNVGAEGWACSKPLLLDIAEINGLHFSQSADLENGRHLCGIPTPWAKGFFSDKDAKVPLGAGKAWLSNEEWAECGWLEFTGVGLEALTKGLQEKESQMAALGARAIEPKVTGDAEAFATVELRASAETISLTTIADAAGASLAEAVKWLVWWGQSATTLASIKVEVKINRDFVSAKLQPAQITALLGAFQTGAISYDTLYYNFAQGELYAPGTTQESEDEARKESMPAPPEPVPGAGGGGAGNSGGGA